MKVEHGELEILKFDIYDQHKQIGNEISEASDNQDKLAAEEIRA